MSTLPNLNRTLSTPQRLEQPPRILLLYGSTRPRSFSRLLVEEAARLLQHFGAETRIFNPSGLPLPDDAPRSDDADSQFFRMVFGIHTSTSRRLVCSKI